MKLSPISASDTINNRRERGLFFLVDLLRQFFGFDDEFAPWGELNVGVNGAGGVRESTATHVDASEMIVRRDAFLTAHYQRTRQFSFGNLQIAHFQFRDSDPQSCNGSRAIDRHRLIQ